MSAEEEEENKKHPVPLYIKATTTTSALEKLSKINFKSEKLNNQEIIHVEAKIEDKLDKNLNETSFSYCFDTSSSVLITFKCKEEIKIFWRSTGDVKFQLLEFNGVSNTETNFCEQFLVSEIKNNKNGLLANLQQRKNLNIQDIGNNKRQNLLILAAVENRDDVVAELLKYDFDVDYEDLDEHNAIENAWINLMDASNLEIKNKCHKIILSLLKNNSKFPRKIKIKTELEERNYEFRYEDCSESIKTFIDYSEKLHNLVTESELEEIKSEIEKEPQLCYFYDRNNKSLMLHAIESKEVEIWKLLISLKLSTGQHEIKNLGAFYKNYKLSKKKLMRAEHQKWAKELPSSHVHFLLTCSRIGNNDRRCDERWTLVEEAYRIMDTDESCSRILKIAAKWKRLTIYFDFKHDTAYYLDPASSLGTKGVIYGAHTIYIGAKYLSDEKMKHKVIGVIIHELCHLAVFLTYINSYNPYPKGESDAKRRFEDEVVPECEDNGHLEEIVGGVALYYPEEFYDSEYIVRVVQMLMHYYVQDPSIECQNSRILKDRREKFGKLFKYFEEIVEKDFDDFLGIVDTLLDEYEDVDYGQLTEPMKARILNSEVKFQGQETTLLEIIGNNEEILKQMTSAQIRDMLIGGECLKIGSKHATSTKVSAIERQFTIFQLCKIINKTFSKIQSEIDDSKVFILSDSAGVGKTTTFEELTVKLKEVNVNFWVCFIKLRTHRSLFDSYDRCKELTLENVLLLLVDVLDFKDNLEAEIFKILFKNDKVIMLLDGVDEISPNYTDFMVKLLKVLKQETKNQLWISSRPQCARILEENLDIKAHNLLPYTIEERETFINEIYDNFYCNSSDKPSIEQQILKLNNLNLFFESMEMNRHKVMLHEVNNPLMIKLITELYIQGQINLNPEDANLFEIFDKVTAKLRREVGQKVESDDNNAFSLFNLGHVHQMLALKTSFSHDDIKDLTIIKAWKEKRTSWTADCIQRFGFVTLYGNFDKDPRSIYIDFTHRTYAEFFVVQFIISVIFDSNCEDFRNCKDFKLLLKMIGGFEILNNSLIAKLLLNFMKSNKNKKIQGSKNIEYICELLDKSIKEFKEERHKNISLVAFFMVILSNNSKTIESIWKLNESPNLLQFLLIETEFGFYEINEFLQISFGLNWDEHFKKSKGNLTFGEFQENGSELKLIEYVENHYNIIERQSIYKNHDVHSSFYAFPEPIKRIVTMKIFMRFSETSSDEEEEAFLEIMRNFIHDYNETENLIFWNDYCESLLQNCCKKDEKLLIKFQIFLAKLFFLFKDYFEDAKGLKRIKRFQKTKKLWLNRKTYQIKMRKSLKEHKIRLKEFKHFSDEDVKDLKDVLLELFIYKKLDIFEIFFYNDLNELLLNEDIFNRFDKFLSDLNDSQLKFSILKIILISNEDLLWKSVSSGLKCFQRISKIYLNNKDSFKTRFENSISFKWGNLFSKILSNMTDEIYPEFLNFILHVFKNDKVSLEKIIIDSRICKPIENQEKFVFLVKFLNDIFDNESIVVDCMKENLITFFAHFKLILNLDSYVIVFVNHDQFTYRANVERFLEILKIYGQFSGDDFEELYIVLKSKNIFLEIISEISNESFENFVKIFNEIFNKFQPLPDECLKCDNKVVTLEFFKNEEKIKNFEKFLGKISMKHEVKKCVKENLIHDNFVYLIKNSVQDVDVFDTLVKFIIDNNCSYNQLGSILMTDKPIFEIYKDTNEQNYQKLIELLRLIFKSNFESIKDCINFVHEQSDFTSYKNNVSDFGEFLLSIVGTENKNILDECMINIFKCIYDLKRVILDFYPKVKSSNCMRPCSNYQHDCINEVFETFICQKHELLLWMFYYEDLNEIDILLKLVKKNRNHWEWAQDLFLDKFPFKSIQRMSNETYNVFEDFLKIVFKSNELKLSEEIQKKYFNDEILNNENENCIKFVNTFIKI